MRVSACPEPSQNRGNRTRAPMTVAVWGAGFRCVSTRTPPEPRQKHRFLQRPRAIWRAPVRPVEQLLLWIRIEAEQQRERDLTRRSAARRISRLHTFCSKVGELGRGPRSRPFATLIGASERARKVAQNEPLSVSNGHDSEASDPSTELA